VPLPPGGLAQALPLCCMPSLVSCYRLLHNTRKHTQNTRAARTRMHTIDDMCGRQENHMCRRTYTCMSESDAQHNSYMHKHNSYMYDVQHNPCMYGMWSIMHTGTNCDTIRLSVWTCVRGTCGGSTYGACCSVLQCVAVCCSVLQCVAVCCSVLQCVAVYCSVL